MSMRYVPNVIDRVATASYPDTMTQPQRIIDLVSVGKATAQDLARLEIYEIEDLVGQDARQLYDRLGKLHGRKLDPCCEDVFRAAIAQAENPDLPHEQKQWWYWSRLRKGEKG